MAFDWRGFFLFAHELRNETDESKRRTSIGRAYYYAYNAALTEAKKLGFSPFAAKASGGVHKRLVEWCQNHSNPDLVILGDAGNTLKA
jgi:hypothetical protein